MLFVRELQAKVMMVRVMYQLLEGYRKHSHTIRVPLFFRVT